MQCSFKAKITTLMANQYRFIMLIRTNYFILLGSMVKILVQIFLFWTSCRTGKEDLLLAVVVGSTYV